MKKTRLQELREAKGWTQVELRNASAVDTHTLVAHERREKRRAHIRTRRAVAGALGVDWQELYTIDGYVK